MIDAELTRPERAKAGRVVGDLYQAYVASLIDTIAARCGAVPAAELVFAIFSRVQRQRFPALRERSGLDGLPSAMVAARRHVLANRIAGEAMRYLPESDRKVWLRSPPPRAVREGLASNIPDEVSRAMVRALHGHDGLLLGDPRLGFVCTKAAILGLRGFEGYYVQYDAALTSERRVIFAEDDGATPDWSKVLNDETDDEARHDEVHFRRAMETVRIALPLVAQWFGSDKAGHLLGVAGIATGMWSFAETARGFDLQGRTAMDVASLVSAWLVAQGDTIDVAETDDVTTIFQNSFALMSGPPGSADQAGAAYDPCCAQMLAGLAGGLAAACDPGIIVDIDAGEGGAPPFVWSIYRHDV